MLSADGKAGVLRAAVGGLLMWMLLWGAPVQAADGDCCPSAGATSALPSALQVLDGALRNGSSDMREAAFEALSRHYCAGARATRDCIRLAAEGLESREFNVRLLDLPNAFLTGMPEPLARRMTAEAVTAGDPTLQRAGAKLLAQHPKLWARTIAENLAHSSDPVVRMHAAAVLVALGDKSYAGVLNQGLDSKDPEVAQEAALHLIQLRRDDSGQARAKMRELLKHRNEVVRANTVYCLSELNHDSWSLGLIEGSFSDDSPLVRIASITSLAHMGLSPSQSDALLRLIAERWPREDVRAIRVDILEAVERLERQGSLPQPAVAQFLGNGLDRQDDRVISCIAMGILSYPDRREYLDRLLTVAETSQGDLNARLVALSELGHSHHPDLTQPLFKLMQQQTAAGSDSAAVRIGCAVAIVRLNDGTARAPLPRERAAAGDALVAPD